MNVGEAIDLLKNSELKQLKIKEDKAAIRGYINLGILEIYKRFNLWQDEATINMVVGTSLYTLDGNDVNVDIDLSDKQLLMIEEIYEESAEKVSLNDESDPYSIFTPQYHQVEIPEAVENQILSVIFRAAPKFLTNEKATIPLPPQFFEALFHYVGFRAHGSIKNTPNTENNSFYKKFENSCDRVKMEGLFAQDSMVSHKFENRGFV